MVRRDLGRDLVRVRGWVLNGEWRCFRRVARVQVEEVQYVADVSAILIILCLLNTIKYSQIKASGNQQTWVVSPAICAGETYLTQIVTFSSLWAKLFMRKETKVLILGLDNAGKVGQMHMLVIRLMNSLRSCIV
jgi:hypothetical protein